MKKGRKLIYKNKAVTLEERKVRANDGSWINGYAVMSLVNGVSIVPVLTIKGKKHIMMVKQWRPAMGVRLIEIPAGGIEKGETPERAARRELKEETGLSAEKLVKIGPVFMAPGRIVEKQFGFIAECRPRIGKQRPDHTENIHRVLVTAEKVRQLLKKHQIKDLKTKALLYDTLAYLNMLH